MYSLQLQVSQDTFGLYPLKSSITLSGQLWFGHWQNCLETQQAQAQAILLANPNVTTYGPSASWIHLSSYLRTRHPMLPLKRWVCRLHTSQHGAVWVMLPWEDWSTVSRGSSHSFRIVYSLDHLMIMMLWEQETVASQWRLFKRYSARQQGSLLYSSALVCQWYPSR